jgi:PAS domain-containing protein
MAAGSRSFRSRDDSRTTHSQTESQTTQAFQRDQLKLKIAGRVGEPDEHKVSVLFTDITARKAAEEALRENERRFRTLADSIPNLAW